MGTRDQAIEKPQSIRFDGAEHRDRHPQEYYDEIKARFAEERDLRLALPAGGHGAVHLRPRRRAGPRTRSTRTPASSSPREPINDNVEVLFIGGGFSALLTSARLREGGVESIRIVERGADVGGTWYWNRYPGVACDVVVLRLPAAARRDGLRAVPALRRGPGDLRPLPGDRPPYDLYELAVFQTTVTSTVWDEDEQLWHVDDRPRRPHDGARSWSAPTARCPSRSWRVIDGMETLRRALVPHVALGLRATPGQDLEHLADKVVGIIGTGASAVQVVPNLGAAAKELYVFQRTPSSIDVRDDWETDPEWAAHAASRAGRPSGGRRPSTEPPLDRAADRAALRDGITREEKIRRQENANIDSHDADPPPHRGDRRGPGDGRGAEAVVHVHVQAAVLPQRLPADVQPARTCTSSTRRARASPRSARQGPIFDGTDVRARPADLRHRLRGAEDRHLQPDRRRGRRRPQRQVRRRHPHAARHPHPRLPEPVHHGRLPGVVPVQPDRRAAGAGRPHRRLHRPRPRATATTRSTPPPRPRSGGCRRSSPTAARPTATRSARPATTTSRAREPPPGRQLQRRLRRLHRPHRRASRRRWRTTSSAPRADTRCARRVALWCGPSLRWPYVPGGRRRSSTRPAG